MSETPENLANYANKVGVSEQVAVKVLKDISNTTENKEDKRLKRKNGPPMVIYTEDCNLLRFEQTVLAAEFE